MTKTVFFLASRFPYPVTNGRDKTLVEYLSFFKDQDVKLIFCYFGKERVESKQINSLQEHIGTKFQEVVFFPLPKLQNVIGSVVLRSFLLQKISMQESLYYSQKVQAELENLTKYYKPNVIFCDMLRTAQYFSNYQDSNTLKIFDMDDILSARYKYLLQHSDNNILGNFSKNLPKFVNTLANSVLKKLILNLEAKLVKKREIILANTFDKVILVSPIEADKLSHYLDCAPKCKKVHALYPSVNVRSLPDTSVKDQYSISFMGLLNVPHNQYALIKFFEEIFPNLVSRIPQIKFYIIGGGASRELLQYEKVYPNNVVFTGYVDDYTVYLLKTKVFVAPIYFGTGIKLKILDAMSLGLPVVTTKIGAEGLMVRNNIDIFIRDDSISFINAVIDLLNSERLADEIGSNALNYVRKHHDYNKLREQFLGILELNR